MYLSQNISSLHLRQTTAGRVITRKPILADETEVQINPRARSARLRCFERIMQQPAEQDGGSLNV